MRGKRKFLSLRDLCLSSYPSYHIRVIFWHADIRIFTASQHGEIPMLTIIIYSIYNKRYNFLIYLIILT